MLLWATGQDSWAAEVYNACVSCLSSHRDTHTPKIRCTQTNLKTVTDTHNNEFISETQTEMASWLTYGNRRSTLTDTHTNICTKANVIKAWWQQSSLMVKLLRTGHNRCFLWGITCLRKSTWERLRNRERERERAREREGVWPWWQQ